jgi:hypothetical protein
MPRHIIHKQTVTLEMPESKDSILLQDKVSHLLRGDLNNAMEAVFDRISANGEVIRIDKLRLDLGEISPANFEVEFKSRLIDELTKAMPGIRSENSNNAIVLKPVESLATMLRYFLEYGRLPWYAGSKQMPEWEAEILEKFDAAEWKALVEWIRTEAAPGSTIIERLIWQFSDKFIVTFLSQSGFDQELVTEPELVFNDLVLVVKELAEETPSVRRFTAWQMILEAAIKRIPLAKALEEVIGKAVSPNSTIIIKILKKRDWSVRLESPIVRKAIAEIAKDAAFVARLKKLQPEETGSDVKRNIEPGSEKQEVKKEIEEKRTAESRKAPEDDGDFIFVQNCGIVILAPFLSPYFAELGLLTDKEFVDEAAQERAVLLLHYLAAGTNEAAEFDLTFQKLLCGLPLDEPLPGEIELTEKEQSETEELLKSVTQHWHPLNNTSIEGLQTSFLQREGKIKELESGWKLQVETKTVDILLDKLPWGYSTIRLPWLSYTIHVEWY